MIVNPAPGALVRDPVTRRALQPGDEVDITDPYWGRLLVDEDLLPADGADAPDEQEAPRTGPRPAHPQDEVHD